jgi:hypothetical protein
VLNKAEVRPINLGYFAAGAGEVAGAGEAAGAGEGEALGGADPDVVGAATAAV